MIALLAAALAVAPFLDASFLIEPPGEIDHSLRQPDPAAPQSRGRIRSQIESDAVIQWTEKDAGRGRVAVYAESVKITMTLRPHIWISSDYAPGSCAYDAVMAHERAHAHEFASIFLLERDPFRARVEAALDDGLPLPRPNHPAIARSRRDAAKLRRELTAKLRSLVQDEGASMTEQMKADHPGLDTPENYAATAKECPPADWAAPTRLGP